MALTDVAIRGAILKDKRYKLADAEGMYLDIHPNGQKYWRLKYRFMGKEKLLALGVYPETTLAEAREKRNAARKMLANGVDPMEDRKETKRIASINAENTFEAIANEWIEAKSPAWTPRYTEFMKKRLAKDILPQLGQRPIKEISAPELLSVIRVIEKRGATELAHRALQYCGQIFMFGIATGRAERNPANDLKGALKTHVKQNYAHLKEEELPEFIKKLENYEGMLQAKLAVKLLMLTFVRTTELRGAMWSEFDFDKAEWRISAERMKMRRPHVVPLSAQALAVLKELKLLNGQWQYVFPNPYKPIKPMSENAVLSVLKRMGYQYRTTGHGFRHTASTILNENGFNADHIERQLAHVEGNKVRGAYNHAEYLPERRKMMQWWADYIEKLQKPKAKRAKAS